jgi:hypothetical protein
MHLQPSLWCGHKTEGTHADKCFKCGVVDWKRDLSAKPAEKSSADETLGCVVVGLGVAFGALWGLVALVHWMWNHS